MRKSVSRSPQIRVAWLLALALAAVAPSVARAQDKSDAKASFELYGHVMLDAGYRTGQYDPDWFDVMRPTKLPGFEDEFAPGGQAYFSVRQTRFGVRSSVPTKLGDLKTWFEFEMFGVGADAGQTTIRLRHAYGELGSFGAGQTWSPFMDIDVFPNTLEYWGPSGMVFFRNIQVRWMPIQGDTRMTIALERPGASGDQGQYDENIALDEIRTRFPLPDLSAEYRLGTSFGYVELAGMLRWIEWDDVGDDEFDLSGDAVGWGLNLSSNVNLGSRDTFRFQVVYGEGIENYMNDATVDIGIVDNPGDPVTPVKGEALPLLGIVAFLDHSWNDQFSSSIGYSMLNIDNTPQQNADAFETGHYAVGNLLYHPVKDVTIGGELQYGKRENARDGFTSDDFKVQISFKYNFSRNFGGSK